MSIRLNFLAEAQAEEEMRRRDPVKRGIWIAGMLVACALLWSATLQIRMWAERSTLTRLTEQFESEGKYKTVLQNQTNLAELTRKFQLLNNYSTNRFLWGSVLNALQLSALEDVQVTHFRADQSYVVTEEVKPKTTDSGRTIVGKPGGITQKLAFYLDAKDTSNNTGDQIENYKAALVKAPFLGKGQSNSNNVTLTLKNLSAPNFDSESGRMVISFSLDCRFSDKLIR